MTTQPTKKTAQKKATTRTSPPQSDTANTETADTAPDRYTDADQLGTDAENGPVVDYRDQDSEPAVSLALHEEAAKMLRENNITPVIVELDGHRFALPDSVDDISGTCADLIAINNIVAVIPYLLDPACPDEGEQFSDIGTRQWALFKSTKPKRPKYVDLYRKWATTQGTTPGE